MTIVASGINLSLPVVGQRLMPQVLEERSITALNNVARPNRDGAEMFSFGVPRLGDVEGPQVQRERLVEAVLPTQSAGEVIGGLARAGIVAAVDPLDGQERLLEPQFGRRMIATRLGEDGLAVSS